MKEYLFSALILSSFIFFAIVVGSLTDYTRCKEIGNALNYKVQWGYWTGCIVEKPDGSKSLLRQLRDFERK